MDMEIVLIYFITAVSAYLIGSIPFGFIIGKSKGIDIREHGSGNIGATNVRRVIGKKYGILCFILDFLKGLVPVITVSIFQRWQIIPESASLAVAFAAFATVAGHVWTVFLKFKGGKGIATSAGAILAMAPYSIICAGLVWVVIFKLSRFVSLASIVAAITLPITAVVLNITGTYPLSASIQWLLAVIAALAVIRHRGNIKRLLNGTENRFKKEKEKSASYATLGKPGQTGGAHEDNRTQ